jgi:hypothetical protein
VIDNLSILLSHALLAFALWRLMNRPDLDHEEPPTSDAEPKGFGHQRRPKGGNSKATSDA